MADPATPPPPTEAPPSPPLPPAPRFSREGTVAGVLVLLGIAVAIGFFLAERYPFTRLDRPVLSVPQFWGSELDSAPVMAELPGWRRVLVLASLSTERELLAAASKDLRALVGLVEQGPFGDAPAEADPLRARLALTLGAAGRWSELDQLRGTHSDELRATVRAAYGRGPLPAPEIRARARAA